MKILRKTESWKRFIVKMGVALILIFLFWSFFIERYRIGIDSQMDKCLPGYSVYLIDLKDRAPKKGEVFAFAARGMEPFFEDGTQIVKILTGMPGDTVEINQDLHVMVNKEIVGLGMDYAEQLQLQLDKFIGKAVLSEGNYWFMGKTRRSFDSRYWGTVKEEQILGRAYALF